MDDDCYNSMKDAALSLALAYQSVGITADSSASV